MDVPPGHVEQARRFVRVLWDDHSVPDLPEDEDKAEARAGAEPATGAAPVEDPDTALDTALDTDTEAAPGEAELERVPEGPAWIVNHVGPRSDELFRDVMARPANSDH